MSDIILSTLNARYIHSSLGLRYLFANMGELKPRSQILEYNINLRPLDIVENILEKSPAIVGFGIYIWNIEQTIQVIKLIKNIRPEVNVVVGGPEVSYEYADQEWLPYVDYLITGNADLAFRQICEAVINGKPPINKVITAPVEALSDIHLPYDVYTDEDIANRIIYVEASRGCPFKCEFCLSALDKKVTPFDLEIFFSEIQKLYERGARHFKFVDRTFNLKVKTSQKILEFFLNKKDDSLFLHFELIPDHLPDQLKEMISRFPPGSLQFEIGIQTLNEEVQQLISRKQDNHKTRSNLKWLRENSHAHIHADLIIGLPGEDLESVANGFDRLIEMQPHEIQVGILKRLKGTPIIRHTEAYNLCFNPYPPYNILSNHQIDFLTMQRLSRFARYWELIANSGRFKHSKALLLGNSPFMNFLKVSDWLYAETQQTHKLELTRLFRLLYRVMTEELGLDRAQVEQQLMLDFTQSGIKGRAKFSTDAQRAGKTKVAKAGQRQQQHSH